MTSYYKKNNGAYMNQLKELAPNQLKAFIEFDRKVFRPGTLTKKEKEIIAVAMAHVTECPYCIDVHTKKAKVAGATLSELAEAVFVVIAMQAGSVFHEYTEVEGLEAYSKLNKGAMEEGELSASFKALIAVAVSYIMQCQNSIDIYTRKALDFGISLQQINEAIQVSAALKAGSAYAHLINLIESYEE